MKINYTELDKVVAKIIDSYKSDDISREAAVGAVSHLIAAAAKDNEPEIQAWINDPGTFDRG